jgi:hypothetical protein
LPQTTEEPHFETSSFRVKGKIFATVPVGGKTLHVFVGVDEARVLIAENPTAFEEIRSGRRSARDWVRVNLAAAESSQVRELLEWDMFGCLNVPVRGADASRFELKPLS